jgi:hypothetical protein
MQSTSVEVVSEKPEAAAEPDGQAEYEAESVAETAVNAVVGTAPASVLSLFFEESGLSTFNLFIN